MKGQVDKIKFNILKLLLPTIFPMQNYVYSTYIHTSSNHCCNFCYVNPNFMSFNNVWVY